MTSCIRDFNLLMTGSYTNQNLLIVRQIVFKSFKQSTCFDKHSSIFIIIASKFKLLNRSNCSLKMAENVSAFAAYNAANVVSVAAVNYTNKKKKNKNKNQNQVKPAINKKKLDGNVSNQIKVKLCFSFSFYKNSKKICYLEKQTANSHNSP